jgi:putative membrane protein
MRRSVLRGETLLVYGDHMDGTVWAAMGLWMVLLLVIVLVVVWAITRSSRPTDTGQATGPRPSARDLLDERLASGEIDVEEYQRRRAALDRHPAPSPFPGAASRSFDSTVKR